MIADMIKEHTQGKTGLHRSTMGIRPWFKTEDRTQGFYVLPSREIADHWVRGVVKAVAAYKEKRASR